MLKSVVIGLVVGLVVGIAAGTAYNWRAGAPLKSQLRELARQSDNHIAEIGTPNADYARIRREQNRIKSEGDTALAALAKVRSSARKVALATALGASVLAIVTLVARRAPSAKPRPAPEAPH